MSVEEPARFDVYLSHNSLDKDIVEEIAVYLKDIAEIKPWLDKWELIPGKPWIGEVMHNITNAPCMAVFLGGNGYGDWQNNEIEQILILEAKKKNIRVIPVLLPGIPDNHTIFPFIDRFTYVDLRNGSNDYDALWRLECGIRDIKPGRGRLAKPIKIPVVVFAMTQDEANELRNEFAFQSDNARLNSKERFCSFKSHMSDDEFDKIIKSYNDLRDCWKPELVGQSISIKDLIKELVDSINNHATDSTFIPEFYSSIVFPENGDVNTKVANSICRSCLLFIDSLSIYHPDLMRKLDVSGLITNEDVSIVRVPPFCLTKEPYDTIEHVLKTSLQNAYGRYDEQFHEHCELGVTNKIGLKRWLYYSLIKIAESWKNPQPDPYKKKSMGQTLKEQRITSNGMSSSQFYHMKPQQ